MRALTALDLTVAPDGSVKTCAVAFSSQSPQLDTYACDLFKSNARFEPAPKGSDHAERHRRDFWVWEASAGERQTSKARVATKAGNSASWITTDDLPKNALRPDQVVTSNATLTIGKTGAVTACRPTLPSERPDLDERLCRLLLARARYEPSRDAEGRPREGADWVSAHWQEPRD